MIGEDIRTAARHEIAASCTPRGDDLHRNASVVKQSAGVLPALAPGSFAPWTFFLPPIRVFRIDR